MDTELSFVHRVLDYIDKLVSLIKLNILPTWWKKDLTISPPRMVVTIHKGREDKLLAHRIPSKEPTFWEFHAIYLLWWYILSSQT